MKKTIFCCAVLLFTCFLSISFALEVTVGVGNEQNRIPMDFYWKNSLFETLYYPAELGFSNGTITALKFYNNFQTNLPNGVTKIWLGNTTQGNLNDAWIPSSQLTLVYSGSVSYPSGVNTITIQLSTPFEYNGTNLVMMVNRPMDTQYYSSSDGFYAQTVGTNRSRRVYGDDTVFNPANPPASASISGQFPKTTFVYTTGGGSGDWIHYDNGINYESIGTGGVADFDVAIRFPASALTQYAGRNLTSVKVWPSQAGSYSVRVWTGGSSSAPGTMVVDQPFIPVLDSYNTVTLSNPVLITGTQELWFGMRCNVTSGHPAGCDAGPAVNGFGNMIYFNGAWSSLLALNSSLDYNWNIQGYVGGNTNNNLLVDGFENYSNFSLSFPPWTCVDVDQSQTYGFSGITFPGTGNPMAYIIFNPSTTTPPTTSVDAHGGQKMAASFAAVNPPNNDWLITPPLTNPIEIKFWARSIIADYGLERFKVGVSTTGPNPSNFTIISGANYIQAPAAWTEYTYSLAGYTGQVYVGIQCVSNDAFIFFVDDVLVTGTDTETVSTPTFNPPGGTYTQAQNVTISSSTSGAQIRYTMDGTEPTSTSTLYTSPVYIGSSVTLKAKGYKTGWNASATATATYNISIQSVATPTFSPPAGTYVNPQNVVIACATTGATIRYTTNGIDPTESSPVYTAPVNVSANLTLKARGFKTNMNPSNIASAVYEMAYPPISVQAVEAGTNVNVAWASPQPSSNNIGKIEEYVQPVNRDRSQIASQSDKVTLTRLLTGYRVWRLLASNQGNESLWTLLTPSNITMTSYTDTGWQNVTSGTYKWAVKAVYTGNVMSEATFSNSLSIVAPGTISGFVRNMSNEAVSGANVSCGTTSTSSSSNGSYLLSVSPGQYNVTASHPDYQSHTQTGVTVVSGQTTNLNFQLVYPNYLTDSFDSYPSFALTFAPWTTTDVDQSSTIGFPGIAWANINNPQAYIIFNPYETIPPLTDPSVVPHSGSRMAACFSANNPPNNDWLISPRLSGVNRLRFWAKSYSSQFGLERFRVGVSTTNTNPSSFVFISGMDPVEPPTTWTEYTYSISQSTPVYFGIQCVSNSAVLFMIDDVNIDNSTESVDPLVIPAQTGIMGNHPNPFHAFTTVIYTLKSPSDFRIDVFNVKGQLVRRLMEKCTKGPGEYSLVWDGKDDKGHQLPNGIYCIQLQTNGFRSIKKAMLRK